MISNRRKIRLTLKSGSSFHEVESRGVRFGYRERDTERQRERFVVLSPHRKRGEGERERRRGDSEKLLPKTEREKVLSYINLVNFTVMLSATSPPSQISHPLLLQISLFYFLLLIFPFGQLQCLCFVPSSYATNQNLWYYLVFFWVLFCYFLIFNVNHGGRIIFECIYIYIYI